MVSEPPPIAESATSVTLMDGRLNSLRVSDIGVLLLLPCGKLYTCTRVYAEMRTVCCTAARPAKLKSGRLRPAPNSITTHGRRRTMTAASWFWTGTTEIYPLFFPPSGGKRNSSKESRRLQTFSIFFSLGRFCQLCTTAVVSIQISLMQLYKHHFCWIFLHNYLLQNDVRKIFPKYF